MFTQTQQPTLHSRKTNGDEIVAQTMVQNRRVYTTFANRDKYVEFILSDAEGAKHCNEVLYGPVHTFFDLDCPLQIPELGFDNILEFITIMNDLLIRVYSEYLGLELHARSILWSESCRKDKSSFHIVIKSMDFCWEASQVSTDLREFAKIVRDESLKTQGLHFLFPKNDEIQMRSVLDIVIYHQNRCFRTVNCRKPGIQKALLPLKNGEHIDITHSVLVRHLITDPEMEKKPYKLLKRRKVVTKKPVMSRTLLERLANQFGCRVHKVAGTLVQLRNATDCRICPITVGCTNKTDNAFIIRKSGALFLGCHSDSCKGKLKKIHQFESRFSRYDDYLKILKLPEDEISRAVIEQYLQDVATFIDIPKNGFFVTSRQTYVKNLPLKSKEVISCPSLFAKHNDVCVRIDGQKVKFSDVLRELVMTRNIPVFENTVWIPKTSTSKYQPKNVMTKFNIFSGFALDSEIQTEVRFPETKIYELIQRLVNYNPECLEFLLNFLSLKIQRPFFKAPLILTWCATKKGCGKGTFKLFLEKLFSCNENILISYNKIGQFTSNFNSELETCLFLVLEEVSANKKNSLKEFSGLLKDISSMTELLIEKKGIDRKVVPFYGSVLVFSNELCVVQVTSDNRRIVAFEVNNEKCNDTQFFQDIYKELDDLQIMKSAWNFFLDRDVTTWDFRKIPQTELLARLQRCSENVTVKFARWYFKDRSHTDILVNENELYLHWCDFCEETGIPNRRDCMFLASNFETVLPCSRGPEGYLITSSDIKKFIR
ncbi:MAG TPA: hypothetical protein EYO60_09995 [Candidatus Lambdaproteobacteria bacterium]|nr:hypothetical protein [Candidatus Lambdaproteobacteria bacterium]